MPWSTPSLSSVRQQNRDYITAKLGQPLIPNDYPRVLADANAGNAHLNLQYLDWLATQLLPDTAEQQFLEKWANIFLVNADGSRGRKVATYASGTASIVATVSSGVTLVQGSQFTALSGSDTLTFQTTAATVIATAATTFAIRALQSGAESNLVASSGLTLASAVPGIDSSSALVVSLTGGTDAETDDELRARLLARIRQPPMGGDADDYVNWALQVGGVTRAWLSPMEMGVGTITLRIMCDDLRASTGGYPLAEDIAAVTAYLNTVRPVTVADFFVEAPVPQTVNFTVASLVPDTTATWAAISTSVQAMIAAKAAPARSINGVQQDAQTIYRAWVSDAILNASGVQSFDLRMQDAVMATPGNIATLGAVTHG